MPFPALGLLPAALWDNRLVMDVNEQLSLSSRSASALFNKPMFSPEPSARLALSAWAAQACISRLITGPPAHPPRICSTLLIPSAPQPHPAPTPRAVAAGGVSQSALPVGCSAPSQAFLPHPSPPRWAPRMGEQGRS